MGSQATREELLALVARINAAAESLDTSEACGVSKGQESLLIECKKLIASVEDADAAVWPRAFQFNVAVSIDIAATLGLWEKLQDRKFVTLSEILKETKSDAGTTGWWPTKLTVDLSRLAHPILSQSESFDS